MTHRFGTFPTHHPFNGLFCALFAFQFARSNPKPVNNSSSRLRSDLLEAISCPFLSDCEKISWIAKSLGGASFFSRTCNTPSFSPFIHLTEDGPALVSLGSSEEHTHQSVKDKRIFSVINVDWLLYVNLKVSPRLKCSKFLLDTQADFQNRLWLMDLWIWILPKRKSIKRPEPLLWHIVRSAEPVWMTHHRSNELVCLRPRRLITFRGSFIFSRC